MASASTKEVLAAISPYVIERKGYYFMFEHEADQAKAKLFSRCPGTYANVEKDRIGVALAIGNTLSRVYRPLLKVYLIRVVKE